MKAHAVPFPATLAVSHEIRNEYMAECARRMLPRLYPLPKRQDRLSVVCFGPTIENTWGAIKPPILTVSGAHTFLIDRGVIPQWHMDCDPRPHKTKFLEPPRKEVTYLMASCCDPKTWEILKDSKVYIWHMHNGPETAEWVKENDPWGMLVGGGSTAGLRALQVGGLLGFSKFDIYGMDGNFVDGQFRAGQSKAPPQNVIDIKVRNRQFQTTDLMLNAAVEYIYTVKNYPIECKLHGDGMIRAIEESLECSSADNSSVATSLIQLRSQFNLEARAD